MAHRYDRQILVSTDDLLAYCKAAGRRKDNAQVLLQTMEPLLRSRVIRAAYEQGERHVNGYRQWLHDPIEDDRATAAVVAAARLLASDLNPPRPGLNFGRCHAVWATQADILWRKHGLRWFSVAQINTIAVD